MLPGSTIEKVDAGIPDVAGCKKGRKRKHESDNRRKAEYRRRKKSELLSELFTVGRPYPSQEFKLGGQLI